MLHNHGWKFAETCHASPNSRAFFMGFSELHVFVFLNIVNRLYRVRKSTPSEEDFFSISLLRFSWEFMQIFLKNCWSLVLQLKFHWKLQSVKERDSNAQFQSHKISGNGAIAIDEIPGFSLFVSPLFVIVLFFSKSLL